MKKSELIDAITESARHNERPALGKADTGAVLDILAKLGIAELKAGRPFEVHGLVRLKVEERPARPGRNPATGETLQLPAKRVVKAKAVKALADAVAGLQTPPPFSKTQDGVRADSGL